MTIPTTLIDVGTNVWVHGILDQAIDGTVTESTPTHVTVAYTDDQGNPATMIFNPHEYSRLQPIGQ